MSQIQTVKSRAAEQGERTDSRRDAVPDQRGTGQPVLVAGKEGSHDGEIRKENDVKLKKEERWVMVGRRATRGKL